MNKVESINQLLNLIRDLRSLNNGFITNLFIDETKISLWIKNEAMFYSHFDNVIFFFKKNNDFFNLYFCSSNMSSLGIAISTLLCEEKRTFMVDLVGKEDQCNDLQDLFINSGYINYCSLVRMSRPTPKSLEYNTDEKLQYATSKHSIEVFNILNNYFDPKAEQLPFIEEISHLTKNQIIIYTSAEQIVGFVIFEKNRTTLYLRYWFVHPNFRDKKIGSKLLNRFYKDGEGTKRQIFWVIRTNENAIKRYKHYGFQEENMFDFVMTNKTIKYESSNY